MGSSPTLGDNFYYFLSVNPLEIIRLAHRIITFTVHEFVPKVTSIIIGKDVDQSNPCSRCESKNCKNVMFGMDCSKICSIGSDDITSCSITRSANTGSTIVIVLLFLFIIPFTIFMVYKYRQFLPRPKIDKVKSFEILLVTSELKTGLKFY